MEMKDYQIFVFLAEHRWIGYFVIVINVIALLAFGTDKLRAVCHKRRIRESTLLTIAFIGGSFGALAGMYLFRHKIRKKHFSVGVPLMLAAHIVVLLLLMNSGWF